MTRPDWTRTAVGEHYTNPAYPQAVVSTITRHGWPRPFSGWVAVVNFARLGVFPTRELAQRYVESYLAE